MNNIIRIRNNNHNIRRNPRKNFRYNDSKNKYKKIIPNLTQKQKLNPKEKFELALTNLKEGLEEITLEFKEKEECKSKEKDERKNYLLNTQPLNNYNRINKRISLSVPKYHRYIRTATPIRDYDLIKKKLSYLNSSNSLHNSYFKTMNNYKINDNFYRTGDINSLSHTKRRNYSRPSYRKILKTSSNINNLNYNTTSNNDMDYLKLNNIRINNDFKNKELNNINNILEKQNKELRHKTRDMRYKINDLLNNIKLLRMDNQRLNDEKNKLLIRISNLENELDINKNMSINELEKKANKISELKEEILRLNLILNEKENEIINLNNKNGNGINELNDYNDEENNNMNVELLNQISDLKNEIEYLRNEKLANGQFNKMVNDNKFNQNNDILIQENRKFKKLYNNLKNEHEKMKNYLSDIQNQKASFEEQQNEYQININDLTQKLNMLEEENNTLRSIINNGNLQNDNVLNKNQGNNNNNENEIINQLLEDNNNLKLQLEKLSKNNMYNNNNNLKDINFLKNDIEEKTNEINDLNEKIKNLKNYIII